jgi:hypothetical protein
MSKALREGVRLRKRGRGRPRRRPRGVDGEGAEDAEAIREAVRGGGFAPASGRTRGGGRRPGRGGLAASMRKRIPRSGGAWRGSWRGGREGFGGFPSRHERLLSTFQGFVYLGCFLIAWRVLR